MIKIKKLEKLLHSTCVWNSLEENDHKSTKAATGGFLLEKVFLKISQISQENTCVGVSFFRKVNKPFKPSKPSESSMNNIAKDIFIIPTGDIHKNNMWKRAGTAKTSSNFGKKIQNFNLG